MIPKMRQEYETIVVGAGPAGLIAGRYLKDSLILEKKQEIGSTVQCGEAISKRALDIQGIKPDPCWISCEIHKIERIMPNGKAMGRRHKRPVGYVVDREKFEKYLAQTVQAEIKLNTEVVDVDYKDNLWEAVTGKGEIFRAKYLIGADGANSVVRRKIFPESEQKIDFIPAIEHLVEVEKELETATLKIYLDNEKYKDGYAWIFPKSRNTANIGVGGRGELKELFNDFLDVTVRKNYGKYRLLENRSGIVPIMKGNISFFKNNALLVGDAGGLINSLSKGGISQAMILAKRFTQYSFQYKSRKHRRKISRGLSSLWKDTNEAAKIWHSLSNNALNGLGEVLEQRGSSYLFTPQGLFRACKNPFLRKEFRKKLKLFRIWEKYRNYLW